MRIVILQIPAARPAALGAAAEAMAREFRLKGYEVDLVAGTKGESPRFAMADYIVVATEPLGLSGKIPPRLADLLGQTPGAPGKRSMAVLLKRGPFRNKAVGRLMKAMEKEGMSVNDWAVVSGARDAAAAAAGAAVERDR